MRQGLPRVCNLSALGCLGKIFGDTATQPRHSAVHHTLLFHTMQRCGIVSWALYSHTPMDQLQNGKLYRVEGQERTDSHTAHQSVCHKRKPHLKGGDILSQRSRDGRSSHPCYSYPPAQPLLMQPEVGACVALPRLAHVAVVHSMRELTSHTLLRTS